MILRWITVITGLCYSSRSCSLPVRLSLKGPWFRGIVKAGSFCKNSQEQEDTAVLESRALVSSTLFFPEAMLILNMALKTNSGHNHFCLILFSVMPTLTGEIKMVLTLSPWAAYFKVCSDLKCSLQLLQLTGLQSGEVEVSGTFISMMISGQSLAEAGWHIHTLGEQKPSPIKPFKHL